MQRFIYRWQKGAFRMSLEIEYDTVCHDCGGVLAVRPRYSQYGVTLEVSPCKCVAAPLQEKIEDLEAMLAECRDA